MLTGKANNQSRTLTEHVLAGKASNHRFASTEQELTGDVTLASVLIKMDILFEKDVRIADTGASNHGTYSDLGGKNVQTSTSSNLGIHGGAVKVEKTIDISGQFVKKNGKEGIKATLTVVNYTPGSNFNVCSVTRLLI